MEKTRRFGRAMVVLAILFFVSTAVVSAQTLDGKWFVMNCQVHAYAVDSTSGDFVICNFPFQAYIYFSYNGPFGTHGAGYDYQIWCQTTPGHWEMTANTSRYSVSISENFFEDWWMGLYTKDGANVNTYITPYVNAVANKFKAGGEIYYGSDAKGRTLFGWLTINGKTVSHPPFPVE